jgi:2-keto-4-pentenoate hydratase/2-oxohepta-3-ene-1,7-dioic acid hydratase in catechol pathway
MTSRDGAIVTGLLVSFWDRGHWGVALMRGEDLAPIEVVSPEGWSDMRSLLQQGEEACRLELMEAEGRLLAGSGVLRRDGVRIGPTVPDPEKILCVGFNYADHTKEMQIERPVAPNIFAKFRNALVADGDPVPLGTRSSQIDYEGELAVVIGRRCRRAEQNAAEDYIAGYTVVNDVTARDLQFRTSQWTLGKAVDGFCPMGPGLVPREHILDVQDLAIVTRLNGHVVQNGSTRDMVFSVAAIVSEISSVITLEPGDVIATGTPAGVGYKADPPRFLDNGDEVEITIEGIGTLTNRFVSEPVVAGSPQVTVARSTDQEVSP